jgi:hypothetical protein
MICGVGTNFCSLASSYLPILGYSLLPHQPLTQIVGRFVRNIRRTRVEISMGMGSKNRKFDFYEMVYLKGDRNSGGHGIRKEIIGKSGIIFGITRHESIYYVFINELNTTYGITTESLESLGQFDRIENLLPEFTAFFLD